MTTRHYEAREEIRTRLPPPPAPRTASPTFPPVIGAEPQDAFASGALPPGSSPSARLQNLDPEPFYEPRDSRPRSVPPPLSTTEIVRRNRRRETPRARRSHRDRSASLSSHSRSRSRSTSRSPIHRDRALSSSGGPRSPLGRATEVLKDSFSNSKTGIGVGLLGAAVGAVGAWVAHDAVENRGRRDRNDYDDYYPNSQHGGDDRETKDFSKSKLALTVLGAVVGGLGANAIEKRFELSRDGGAGGRDDDYDDEGDRDYDGGRRRTRDLDRAPPPHDDGDRYSHDRRSVDTEARRARNVRRDSGRELEYSYEERGDRHRRSRSYDTDR